MTVQNFGTTYTKAVQVYLDFIEEVLNYHLHKFINTSNQLIGQCMATCFDRKGHLQAIWHYKHIKQVLLHKPEPHSGMFSVMIAFSL